MKHEWMKEDRVDILQHLPPFLRKDKQFQETNNSDSEEHEKIRLELQELLDQLFIKSATWGLDYWEKLLGIESTEGTDIGLRRKEVIYRLKKPGSVTNAFLTKLINQFISDNAGFIIPYNEEYRIEILYHGGTILDYSKLRDAINLYIPAHIGYKLITHTIDTLCLHGAGTVQSYQKISVDMTTTSRQQVDDTRLHIAGKVTHNYNSFSISGGY